MASAMPKKLWVSVIFQPSTKQWMQPSIVALDPVAVELIDDTMLELARSIPLFKPIVEEAVKGEPAALLVVEFAEEDEAENLRRLARLHEMMSDLGFGWDKDQEWTGGVIDATDPGLQGRVAEMRKSGLNIMMSMKQSAKPVSFVEDCAVELKHLADYTAGLTEILKSMVHAGLGMRMLLWGVFMSDPFWI